MVSALMMTVQKPVFLLYYHAMAEDLCIMDFFSTVGHGLILDSCVAGYIVAIPLVVILLGTAFSCPNRILRRIIGVWLTFVGLIESAIYVMDLGLYEYWGFRLDSQILHYLSTPEIALASLTPLQAVMGTVAFIVLAAAIITLYFCVLKLYPYVCEVYKWPKRVLCIIVLLVIGGLDFLAIRGSVSTAVANVSMVYYSSNMFLNHAATNPVFTFIDSVFGNSDDTSGYEFMPEQECDRIIAESYGEMDEPEKVLRTSRPNIVMVIAESFSRVIMDEFSKNGDVYPSLRRYSERGVLFENMYANSFRTDRGNVAILSGFPSQPKMSLSKNPMWCRNLISLPRALQKLGYHTSYVYGGDGNFTDSNAYLYNSGIEQILDYHKVHIDAPQNKWGYHDDVMFDYFWEHFKELSGSDPPFFTALMTLSSHEPFEVPYSRFEDKVLNAMAFTDDCLGRFLDRLYESDMWDNTLVIVVADHACLYPETMGYNTSERHHIPMLWTGGAVSGARRVVDYMSQIDISVSLLSQMGIHEKELLGRDVFSRSPYKFGYWTFNDGFGVIDQKGCLVWDCVTDSALVSTGEESEYKAAIGHALLQKTFQRIRSLKNKKDNL